MFAFRGIKLVYQQYESSDSRLDSFVRRGMIAGVKPNPRHSAAAPPSRISALTVFPAIALLVICATCFSLRIMSARDNVLPVDGVPSLQENDPWYHLRNLTHQVHNFPHRLPHDPFLIYPDGAGSPVGPFFDLSLAAVVRTVYGDSPSEQTLRTAAAYYPPIFAVLVCVVIYLTGAVIFNRWAGLIAAAMIAVIPGPYFARSCLGFYDHHVMEVLLSTLVLLLLACALNKSDKAARAIQTCIKFAIPAGIALGCYLLTWPGGGFIIFILLVWALVQSCRDHLAGELPPHRPLLLFIVMAIATLLLIPYRDVFMAPLQLKALLTGLVCIPLLFLLSLGIRKSGLPPFCYPVTIAVAAVCTVLVLRLVDPSLFNRVLSEFSRFTPDARARSITEARPMLMDKFGFTLSPLWERFTTTFPLSVIALACLTWRFIRGQDAQKSLLLIWSVIVLGAMFGQSRFSYYAAACVSLLVGYLCCTIVCFVWHLGQSTSPKKPPTPGVTRRIACALITLTLLAIAFVPSLMRLPTAMHHYDGPSSDWRETLTWLRENSPEPFGPGAYVRPCSSREDQAKNFDPATGYGVMSWWDYGYWINAIARRIPNSNPTQNGAVDSAKFFLAQDEDAACTILDRLGARYVVMDWLMPRWEMPGSGKVMGKFAAFPLWAEDSLDTYFERVNKTDERGNIVSRFLYYPPYYRSMCARLFVFSGKAVRAPKRISVYLLELPKPSGSTGRKKVLGVQDFDRLEDAQTLVNAVSDGTRRIAGESPFIPCVPVSSLQRFRLIHQSPTKVGNIVGVDISQVRLFEYLPNLAP